MFACVLIIFLYVSYQYIYLFILGDIDCLNLIKFEDQQLISEKIAEIKGKRKRGVEINVGDCSVEYPQ
jgi:hypothetical protein